jgi:hypothetical protein
MRREKEKRERITKAEAFMRMAFARGSSYDVDLFRRFGRIWLKDSPVAVASLLWWRRGPGETHPAGSFSPLRATLLQLAELPDAQQEHAERESILCTDLLRCGGLPRRSR